MISCRIKKIVLCIVVAICHVLPLSAQELDADYILYKYYDDEEEQYLNLLEEYQSVVPDAGAIPYIASNAEFAMRGVTNNIRGGQRGEEVTMLGAIPIDYTTSSALSTLGIRRMRYPGLSNASLSGTTTSSLSYNLEGEKRYRFDSHDLRGDISGRNYLAAISYRGTYRISHKGIELSDDWVLTSSARARMGRDIYVDGVNNNSFDIALHASREWKGNSLHLIAIAPYSTRGTRKETLEECFTLTNNYLYNPSWGMQAGKMRNANIATELRPEIIALWRRELSDNTSLRAMADISYDLYSYSTLSNIDAPTAAPDNYQRLPSYFTNEESIAEVTAAWRDNDLRYTQIDWDYLYHTNALQSDGHAAYIVDKRHNNILRTALTAEVEHHINSMTINGGVIYDMSSAHLFRSADDMLGADHILDYDYFNRELSANGVPPKNNLRDEDIRVTEGDHFGYDYLLTRHHTELYGSLALKYGRNNFAVGIHLGTDISQRRGNFEKELFPGRGSYGKSQSIKHFPYRINIGWTHSIRNHHISASAMLRGATPKIDMLFLQPQYNNRTIPDPELSTAFAAEASYHYRHERVEVAATLFVTTHTNMSSVVRYYDDMASTMANAVVNDIGVLNFGIEASAKVRWMNILQSSFALTAAQYRYMRNANIMCYADADNRLIANTTSYIKGYHTSTPEVTLYGDLEFRPKGGWMARLSASYWGMRYAEPSFIRRSERITSHAPSKEEYNTLMAQQRLKDAVLVDAVVAKTFKLKGDMSIRLQLSVNNLLGSKVVYRSYEQHRVRRINTTSHTHLMPFGNMTQYGYGRTFKFMVSLWF